MPTYEITTPQGKFRVDSPTELTDEQAYSAATGGETPKQPGVFDKVLQGGADLATGFGKMGTMLLSPYDMAVDAVTGQPLGSSNRERREGVESFGQEHGANDWTSTVNNIAPEMALTGGPLAGIPNAVRSALPNVANATIPKAAAKYLPKAVNSLIQKTGATTVAAAPAAADIGVQGAYEGAKSLARDETPEQAATSAKWGAGGAAGGRLLTGAVAKLGQPVATSPITQMMLDEGIELTPGQAGKGGFHRMLEGSLYNTPFMPGLRRSIGRAQHAGQEQAEDFLTNAGRIAANPAAHGLDPMAAQNWVQGASRINDTGMSTIPLTAILSMLHLPTGGTVLAATSALYGTQAGRRFLLGQMSFQELMRQAPELGFAASQVMRSVAGQSNSESEGQQE